MTSTAQITIREVVGKADEKEFLQMPHRIYAGYDAWVAPLDMEAKKIFDKKYPFRSHSKMKFFLASQNGIVVGRIAAIIDSDFIEKWKQRIGHFGFFECINDSNVAKLLFQTAEKFLIEERIELVHGPMNPSTNYTCGILMNAYELSPYLDMTYNPPYYITLLEELGFRKNLDLNAYFYTPELKMQERLRSLGNYISQKNNITIRPVNMKKFSSELEIMRGIYNDAWDDNFGFVPVSKNEFNFICGQMKSVAIPDMVLFAFINDEPAGFIAALPDYNVFMKEMKGKMTLKGAYNFLFNRKKIKATRVITFGVKKVFRKKGLDIALLNQLMINWTTLKFEEAELSWILEDNVQMIREIEKFGASHYKTYRIYGKSLQVN